MMTTHAYIKPYSGTNGTTYNHIQTYKCEPLDRADLKRREDRWPGTCCSSVECWEQTETPVKVFTKVLTTTRKRIS